jgi:hypothetical protein
VAFRLWAKTEIDTKVTDAAQGRAYQKTQTAEQNMNKFNNIQFKDSSLERPLTQTGFRHSDKILSRQYPFTSLGPFPCL